MTRENINDFKGRNNVSKLTSDDGRVSYLTQSTNFINEANATGACKLNTVENEKKHALFLFNAADAEVGRYYLCQSLQGKTPAEIAELKHNLVIFESFNTEDNSWVPCITLSSQTNLSQSAVRF